MKTKSDKNELLSVTEKVMFSPWTDQAVVAAPWRDMTTPVLTQSTPFSTRIVNEWMNKSAMILSAFENRLWAGLV